MSTALPAATVPAFIHEVSAALRREDLAGAERLLNSSIPAPAAPVLISAAESAMRTRRWRDAAWFFDRIPQRDSGCELKRCVCRNLASLQVHRPALYQILIALPADDRCGIAPSLTGRPTVVCRRADGQVIALSPGNDPLRALSATMAGLKPVLESGHAFALCGVGDGYLLHQLAHKPVELFLGMQQAVLVLEPDAHVVLQTMMIHDYTGPQGPIEQPRFQWFIGPDWLDSVERALHADPFLPCPAITIGQGLGPAPIQAELGELLRKIGKADEQTAAAVEQYYAATDRTALASLFGENPPRRPRVLLMTTRFSTVLQYSTRDAAAGFEQAGWDARVLIEPSPYHRLFNAATRRTLAEFRPDLVFQIDHLRSEHADLFPPSLPFACWIQDHMPQLMSREAGARVGACDFVLTDAGPTYVHTYEYPRRQVIALAKLTTPPPLLPRSADRGDDLVFVSNASATPEALLDTLHRALAWPEADRPFLGECVSRLVDLHANGHTLATYPDVCEFLRGMLRESGQETDGPRFRDLARYISHPVCDALYRHQALRWAAAAADDLGLTFSLYGKGWDAHPQFARYARGPVAAGQAAQELSRRAAINLQIAPYLCLHQRLLDGISGGAFFLVRNHVADVAPQAMLDLVEAYCPSDVGDLAGARKHMPPPVRERFEQLAQDCGRSLCSMGTEDPIEMVRAWQEARLLEPFAGVLPHLDEISFSDAASLRARVERFVRDADGRERIVAVQRQNILGRLTYGASMARVARRIGQILPAASQAASAATARKFDMGSAA
ncbi:MAG: hypothetical protein JWP03_168 [Phycisphaerales bacterium]|nr:hypothetical protein [Phycisphaerales bacterium]